MWVRSPGQEDPEKEMATHCSILAWEIPWTEQPGRLQSMGSQRVGHDWACTHALPLNNSVSLDKLLMFSSGQMKVENALLAGERDKMLCWSCSARCWTHTANGMYSVKENECGRYHAIVTWWKGRFKEVSVDECAAQTGKGTQLEKWQQLEPLQSAGHLRIGWTVGDAGNKQQSMYPVLVTVLTASSWPYNRFFFFLIELGLRCGLWDLVPQPRPPLHWECGVLATGPPRKSLHKAFFIPLFIL